MKTHYLELITVDNLGIITAEEVLYWQSNTDLLSADIKHIFLLTHMWVLVEKHKEISAWTCKDKLALLHNLLESSVKKLQVCRNGKTAYSPLGRLAKSLTSMSFVLLAGSSFSSEKKSFWKLWGAGKIPSVIATRLNCGKLDCLCTDSVGKCTEQSESDRKKEHPLKDLYESSQSIITWWAEALQHNS